MTTPDMLPKARINELLLILADDTLELGPLDLEDLGWNRGEDHLITDDERLAMIRVLQEDFH